MLIVIKVIFQNLLQCTLVITLSLRWVDWMWQVIEYFECSTDFPLLTTITTGEYSFYKVNELTLSSILCGIEWGDLPKLNSLNVGEWSFFNVSRVVLTSWCLNEWWWDVPFTSGEYSVVNKRSVFQLLTFETIVADSSRFDITFWISFTVSYEWNKFST